jgi:transcriptional regulator with XRE-family HTH domain
LALTVGQRLRQLRQERGLTAEKVAYESDVGSKGYVSDIEHGLALPSLRTLERLASYLEVELFDLVVQPESGPRAALVDRSRLLDSEQLAALLSQIAASADTSHAEISRPALRAVRAYPALEVAAGWARVTHTTTRATPEFVRLPGTFDRSRDFAVRASGTSMQGWRTEIRNGDWLVLRWANLGLRAADGKVALIAREDKYGDKSLHVKRVVCSSSRVQLRSEDPTVAPVTASEADSVLALLRAVIRPESLAPRPNTEIQERGLARAFGIRSTPKAPVSRVDGHLFLFARSIETVAQGIGTKVADSRPAETAFVLVRTAGNLRYLGIAQFNEEPGRWMLRSRA